jgi:hypothetical protein
VGKVGVLLPTSDERTSEDDGLATTKGPGVKEKALDHHLREIADCLDEVLRLQSRVMDLTEQVSEAAERATLTRPRAPRCQQHDYSLRRMSLRLGTPDLV